MEFKVGDIVKIINERPRHGLGGCNVGDVGKIKKLPDESDYIIVDFPRDHNWFATSFDIKLVQEEITPSKFKFKVGDRVEHERYGLGRIRNVDEEDDGDYMPYDVDFMSKGRGLRWCREDEIELVAEDIKEQDVTDINVGDNNLDTLVKKIIEITENYLVKFEFYGGEVLVDLYDSAIIIQYIAKTNAVYLELELSAGKIDPETLMQVAKVTKLLEQNKVLLKEFCKS